MYFIWIFLCLFYLIFDQVFCLSLSLSLSSFCATTDFLSCILLTFVWYMLCQPGDRRAFALYVSFPVPCTLHFRTWSRLLSFCHRNISFCSFLISSDAENNTFDATVDLNPTIFVPVFKIEFSPPFAASYSVAVLCACRLWNIPYDLAMNEFRDCHAVSYSQRLGWRVRFVRIGRIGNRDYSNHFAELRM